MPGGPVISGSDTHKKFFYQHKTHTHIKKTNYTLLAFPPLFIECAEKHNRAELERKRKKNSGKCNEGVS